MKRLHYIQTFLLIVAAFVFVIGLTYLNEHRSGGDGLLTSLFFTTQEIESEKVTSISSQTYLEPLGLSITEKRAIYFLISLSFFILATIIYSALIDRQKNGRHTIQVPFIAVSILLTSTFSAQLFRIWPF